MARVRASTSVESYSMTLRSRFSATGSVLVRFEGGEAEGDSVITGGEYIL
jgi:hypothetical protein